MKKSFNSIIFFLLITLLAIKCDNERMNFNSTKWINWKENERIPSERWLMSKDLLHNFKLIDLPKDSILNILGKPEQEFKNEFFYNLGNSGFSQQIDPAFLMFKFKNDTVVEIKLIVN